jgi:glutamate/tyrosine decarboxylase-like PLP-dependent enzyme
MNQQLQQDLDHLPLLLEKALKESIAYLDQIDTHLTSHAVNPSFTPIPLYNEGIGTEAVLQEFLTTYQSIMVATSGPRYLGFVTGGTTPASIVGDWLKTVYDQNAFNASGQGDISSMLELDTIRLLLELLDLPLHFIGGFVTGATMSNFTCLATARQWAGKQVGKNIALDGMESPFPVLTATPHSSIMKSLSMLGMGSRNIITVPRMGEEREAIDWVALEKELETRSGQPCILISSGGTVNTVDFDDMQAIAALKERYNFWWHIDAAFGAFAVCSPEHKHLLKGWEHADSITIDCHKWLNVPYDSAIFLVQEQHKSLKTETFQNANAPYLGDPAEHFSYLNLLPENSRSLRALPAWFTLKAYGKEGYRDIVQNSIAMAQQLGTWIDCHPQLQLLAPVRLNTVCFTIAVHSKDRAKVNAFLSDLNHRGKVFMTPTHYRSAFGVRAAFVNWRTRPEDIQLIIQEIEAALDATA